MIEAVELRLPPTQCNFQPLLAENPPDRCEADTERVSIFRATFEGGPGGALDHEPHPVDARDLHAAGLGGGSTRSRDRDGLRLLRRRSQHRHLRRGSDESGVLRAGEPLDPARERVVAPRLTFDHWVATEAGFDGGNLRVSVEEATGSWSRPRTLPSTPTTPRS